MEIIQQKLIWFLGCFAALILLFKLQLGRAGMRKNALTRIKTGIIILMAGSFMGITVKAMFPESGFALSGYAFFIETLLGYILGWAFIIWGLVSWARSYFDMKGKPLTTAGSRIISDAVLSSLLKGNAAKLLFNSLAKDIFSILDCHALTFHRSIEKGRLKLAFHKGLTDSSARLLEFPRGERSVFLVSARSRQGVISDRRYVLHEFSYPETPKGAITGSISLPVIYNGQLLGVLSAYRIKKNPFKGDDLRVLEPAAAGIGAALQKEDAEREHQQDNRYRELLSVAVKSLGTGEPMVSALIKSAKLIHNYLPFKWICLYAVGNDTPREYEFNLPTGGMVKVVEGWLDRKTYPQLFNRDPNTGLNIGPDSDTDDKKTTYVFPIGKAVSPDGYIEFELSSPISISSYLPLLGNIMTKRFSNYLQNDRYQGRIETFNSWLGALQYFHETAVGTENVSSLLKEIASSTVELTPASFCRITIADSARKYLTSAALAQVRDLNWRSKTESRIPLEKAEFHKTALLNGAVVKFNQKDQSRRLSGEEAVKTLPSEVKCGAILPLTVGQKIVGLMTVGDCRKTERVFADTNPMHFLNSLAGTISMILTWHKEKRISRQGNRKLTSMQQSMAAEKKSGIEKPVTVLALSKAGPTPGRGH